MGETPEQARRVLTVRSVEAAMAQAGVAESTVINMGGPVTKVERVDARGWFACRRDRRGRFWWKRASRGG